MKTKIVNKIWIVTTIIMGLSSCLPEQFEWEDVETTSPYVNMNIIEFINSQDSLSLFTEAVKKAGYETLLSTGTYTVIAPDNVAFRKFLSTNTYKSIEAYPVSTLQTLVANHIVPDQNLLLFDPVSTDIQYFTSLSGKELSFYYNNDIDKSRFYRMFVNGIQISTQGWQPTNGVVHVTNRGVIK